MFQVLHQRFNLDSNQTILAALGAYVSAPRKAFRLMIIQIYGSRPRWSGHIRRRLSRKKRFRGISATYSTVSNVNKQIPGTFLVGFDNTAAATIICDNSANIHICNGRNMFETLVAASASKVVATIGGQVNVPAGIGTVIWSWKDDKNETHTHRIENMHYFPTSPFNIPGITALGSQLNDKIRQESIQNGGRVVFIGRVATSAPSTTQLINCQRCYWSQIIQHTLFPPTSNVTNPSQTMQSISVTQLLFCF